MAADQKATVLTQTLVGRVPRGPGPRPVLVESLTPLAVLPCRVVLADARQSPVLALRTLAGVAVALAPDGGVERTQALEKGRWFFGLGAERILREPAKRKSSGNFIGDDGATGTNGKWSFQTGGQKVFPVSGIVTSSSSQFYLPEINAAFAVTTSRSTQCQRDFSFVPLFQIDPSRCKCRSPPEQRCRVTQTFSPRQVIAEAMRED